MEASSEKDLLISIKAALAIEAFDEVFDCLSQLAQSYIARGWTQEGADILAYLLRSDAIPDESRQTALELWEDLERWICPRVLVDAEDFANKATFTDLLDYVFA